MVGRAKPRGKKSASALNREREPVRKIADKYGFVPLPLHHTLRGEEGGRKVPWRLSTASTLAWHYARLLTVYCSFHTRGEVHGASERSSHATEVPLPCLPHIGIIHYNREGPVML